jgi:predicted transcriptional regulator
MKTVTCKIPETLDARIRRVAARRKESISELARRAFTREVEEQDMDFASMAAPYQGMFVGESDLSNREGYGNPHNR